jgi:hypothetical protein
MARKRFSVSWARGNADEGRESVMRPFAAAAVGENATTRLKNA